MTFARLLIESGVPWDAIHHQVAVSRWIFDTGHPAATAGSPRWCADLALLHADDFLAAELPAKEPGFQFDACLEFAYLSDYWMLAGARNFGEPERAREKVRTDVEKIGRYLNGDACRFGYVIVFAECDYGFGESFVGDAETQSGCRVRFTRDHPL